jgi:RNA polymerase sigma-70 factor (ECF subfamily)
MNSEMKRQVLCITQPEIKLLYQFTARSERKQARNSEAEGKDPSISLKDKALVVRAQSGDRTAFGDLVKMYQGKAYAIAYSMCSGDGEEARELTQEAFLRAFQNLKSFRGKSSFYTWYYRILINICLDNRRRRGRWEKIFSFWRRDQNEKATSSETNAQYPDPQEHSDPMTALNNKQLAQEIRHALASLPEKQRVVFQLKVLHGMQIREIADIMGSAEGTIKSHLFRATHFMREALQEWAQP